MTPAPPVAPPRLLALVRASLVAALVWTILLTGWTGLPTPTAAAGAAPPRAQASEQGLAVVRLDSVTPTAPRPGQEVVLTGTLRNTSTEPLTDVRLYLRASQDRLESRGDVELVLEDPQVRGGVRTDVLAAPEGATVAPGDSLRWRLALDPQRDAGIDGPGVFVIGVDAIATPAGRDRTGVGRARTLLPWDVPTTRPVPTALLWPVLAPPTVLANGTTASATTSDQLRPQGRLRSLVDAGAAAAAARAPLTWLVDPDLVDTLARLADGAAGRQDASVARDAGVVRDALRDGVAAAAGSGAEPLLLPFADVDAAALSRSGDPRAPQVVARAVRRSRSSPVPGTPAGARPRVAAWPLGGAVDDDSLGVLRSTRPDLVLLAAPPVEDLEAPSTGAGPALVLSPAALPDGAAAAGGPALVGVDDALSTALAAQRAADLSAVQVRQLLLATTALSALGSSEGRAATPLVLAPDRRWAPDRGTADAVLAGWREAPWVRPVPLTGAVAATPTPASVVPVAKAPTALGQAHVRGVLDLDARTAAVTSVADDSAGPPAALAPLRDSVLRSASATWRFAPRAARDYLDRSLATARFRDGQLRVLAPAQVTLSGSSGRFPVTVRNDLPAAVRVQLRVRSSTPGRLRLSAPSSVRAASGTTSSVPLTAEASANGATRVTIELVTPSGTVVGRSATVTVVASGYGLVGWAVIAVAGSVLLGLASVRTARRLRAARRSGPVDPPDPGDRQGADPVVAR